MLLEYLDESTATLIELAQTGRQVDRWTGRQVERWAGRQVICRQVDRWSGSQIDRQTEGQVTGTQVDMWTEEAGRQVAWTSHQ